MPFVTDMLQDNQRRRQASATVAEVSSDARLVTRFRFSPEAVVRRLRENILGQEHAIEAIQEALTVVRADITDPERPLFVCLLMGPTGVGKTETVRILAEAIHGDRNAFCRVDMNTLSQEHYAAALTGAPPGYVGSRDGNTILDEEKIAGSFSKPGIVLFDEIEKASPEVVQALLNVFDNGQMRIASGERIIDFRNAMIFMTSNIGARDIQRYESRQSSFLRRLLPLSSERQRRAVRKIVDERLMETFEPEFINRIDNITMFSWLEGDLIADLVQLELGKLNRRLRRHRCRLHLTPAATQFLAQQGFDRRYGARSLRRAVRRHLEVPFAELLLSQEPIEAGEASFVGEHDGKRIVFQREPT
jgi:ATP-dependent Clp protease ATP-binding subunit ClpA